MICYSSLSSCLYACRAAHLPCCMECLRISECCANETSCPLRSDPYHMFFTCECRNICLLWFYVILTYFDIDCGCFVRYEKCDQLASSTQGSSSRKHWVKNDQWRCCMYANLRAPGVMDLDQPKYCFHPIKVSIWVCLRNEWLITFNYQLVIILLSLYSCPYQHLWVHRVHPILPMWKTWTIRGLQRASWCLTWEPHLQGRLWVYIRRFGTVCTTYSNYMYIHHHTSSYIINHHHTSSCIINHHHTSTICTIQYIIILYIYGIILHDTKLYMLNHRNVPQAWATTLGTNRAMENPMGFPRKSLRNGGFCITCEMSREYFKENTTPIIPILKL